MCFLARSRGFGCVEASRWHPEPGDLGGVTRAPLVSPMAKTETGRSLGRLRICGRDGMGMEK